MYETRATMVKVYPRLGLVETLVITPIFYQPLLTVKVVRNSLRPWIPHFVFNCTF